MPRTCRRTGARWGLTRRGSGRPKATRDPGRRASPPPRRRAAAPPTLWRGSANARNKLISESSQPSYSRESVVLLMRAATMSRFVISVSLAVALALVAALPARLAGQSPDSKLTTLLADLSRGRSLRSGTPSQPVQDAIHGGWLRINA